MYYLRVKTNQECGITYSDHVQILLDFNTDTEGLSDQIFQIFPNPSSEFCIINSELFETQDFKLLIYDIQGRIIKSQWNRLGSSSLRLDLNNLDKGVYFIKCVQGNLSFDQKIIKI